MSNRPLEPGRQASRLTSQLDPLSRWVIRRQPQGMAGVFLRGAVSGLVGALEAGEAVPEVEPGPGAVPFAWKATDSLVGRMRRFVGPGKPYSCLSHLVRAAIARSWSNPPTLQGGSRMKAKVFVEVDFELGEADAYPEEVASWEEAARFDFDHMNFGAGGFDAIVTLDRIQLTGSDEPFVREASELGVSAPEAPGVPERGMA